MARKNYTAREKEDLKIIVEKYKGIIENKHTNALIIAKKVEAWDAVALEFNSSAEYPRTAKQLLGLYNNLKRSTRQDLANDNMERYIQQKENEILKKIKKDEAQDKKEIRATGGGTFSPALGAADARMLAIMGPQIKPLYNDVDSASFYHNVEIEEVNVMSVGNHSLSEDLHEEAKEPSKLPRTITKKKKQRISLKGNKTEILKNNIYKKKLETAVFEKKEALIKLRIAQKQERLIDIELKIKEHHLSNLQKNQAL